MYLFYLLLNQFHLQIALPSVSGIRGHDGIKHFWFRFFLFQIVNADLYFTSKTGIHKKEKMPTQSSFSKPSFVFLLSKEFYGETFIEI